MIRRGLGGGGSGTTRAGALITTGTLCITTRTSGPRIAATTTTIGRRGGTATLVFLRGRHHAIKSHRLNGGHNGAFRTLTVIATGTGTRLFVGLTVAERLGHIHLDGLGRQRDTHRGNTGGQGREHGTFHGAGATTTNHGGCNFKVVTG